MFLLLLRSWATGEELSLTAQLDRSEIPFEGTVGLDIAIKWQGGIGKYAFGLLPLPAAQNLQVLGSSSAISSGSEAGQEFTTRKFHYDFKPTKAGIGIIEPIVLKYVSLPDSTPGELSTQQFQVLIAAPVPRPVKSNIWRNLFITAIAAILAMAAILLIKSRRKKDRKIEPYLTPEQNFVEQLALIRKESGTDRKIFFTRLYKILVEYLEKKYSRPLSGQPAAVICEQLTDVEMGANQKEKLFSWLNTAEKEKYAPVAGSPGDTVRLISELEQFFGK